MKRIAMGCAVALCIALTALSEAVPTVSQVPRVPKVAASGLAKFRQVGIASWYGEECDGNPTASGEPFDMYGLTAAHWELPFGTRIRVTNLRNKRCLILRVNDRGPGICGRVVDVSMEAARRLGFVGSGLVPVQLEVVYSPGLERMYHVEQPIPDEILDTD
jgi:rare lipoprotein A (peptidoglycan hydrolase)